MTLTKIVSLLAFMCALHSAESQTHELPPGATPFEEVSEIGDNSVKVQIKTAGYKLEAGGKKILVGPWKAMLGETVSQDGFYDKEGKKTGTWTKYFANGKPYLVMNYKSDVLDGFFTAFGPEGKPMAIKWFVDGKAIGLGVNLSADGKVVSAEKYKNGEVTEVIKAE